MTSGKIVAAVAAGLALCLALIAPSGAQEPYTGVISTTFKPVLNSRVTTVLSAGDGTSVYVAGNSTETLRHTPQSCRSQATARPAGPM